MRDCSCDAKTWEQRKLKEFSSSFSGGTPLASCKDFYVGDIPFIRSGEINSEKTELFISKEALSKSSAKLVEKGDILYALYGATSGEVARARLSGAINQAILAIKVNKDSSPDFVTYYLQNAKKKIISTYLQGGQGNLSGEIVNNLKISQPQQGEQKKIGDLFLKLEKLITLHQRARIN
jgi:type I restriction enzyme S subunit